MTIKTHTESSKTELSSGGKRPFKVWRFFFKINFFPPMEGIFFSRRTVGSFFFPHATEGVAYITSAQDNISFDFIAFQFSFHFMAMCQPCVHDRMNKSAKASGLMRVEVYLDNIVGPRVGSRPRPARIPRSDSRSFSNAPSVYIVFA